MDLQSIAEAEESPHDEFSVSEDPLSRSEAEEEAPPATFQLALLPAIQVIHGDVPSPDLQYKKGQELMRSTNSQDMVVALQYDGEVLHFGSADGHHGSFDLLKGSVVQQMDFVMPATEEEKVGRRLALSAMDVTPGCQEVLAGGENGDIGVWNLDSGAVTTMWKDHHLKVSSVHRLDTSVYSVGYDGYFLVRDVPHDRVSHSYINCTCPLSSLAVLDANKVIFGSWDGTIRQLDLREKKCVRTIELGEQDPVRTLKVAGNILACSFGSSSVRTYDQRMGNVAVASFAGHTDVVNTIEILHDRLFTASDDKTVRVFDLGSGICLDALTGHEAGVSTLCIAGELLVSGSYDCSLRRYLLPTVGQMIQWRQARLEAGRLLAQELWLKQCVEAQKREKGRRKKKKKGKKKGKRKKKAV